MVSGDSHRVADTVRRVSYPSLIYYYITTLYRYLGRFRISRQYNNTRIVVYVLQLIVNLYDRHHSCETFVTHTWSFAKRLYKRTVNIEIDKLN